MPPSTATDESTINLAEMIDLAIRMPESGMVDFNVLQAVLHILAQQIGAINKTIHIKSSLVSPTLITTMKSGHTIDVKEYNIESQGKEKCTVFLGKNNKNSDFPDNTVVVVDRVKKDKSLIAADKKSAAEVAKAMAGLEGRQPVDTGLNYKDMYETLERKVMQIMQHLNLDTKEFTIAEGDSIPSEPGAETDAKSAAEAFDESVNRAEGIEGDFIGEDQEAIVFPTRKMMPTGGPGIPPTYEDIVTIYGHLNELQDLIRRVYESGSGAGGGGGGKGPGEPDILELMDRINKVARAQEECCEDNALELKKIFDYINYLENQVALLGQKVAELAAEPKLTQEYIKAIEGIDSLLSQLEVLENQYARVFDTMDWLEAERNKRQEFMNDLIEQIEILKAIKMDKEDTADALAEKADLADLAEKVSNEKFEEAYEDLRAGLDEAIKKLEYQEMLWRQAIDEIQEAMNSKLSRVDLEPVKDYLYLKLKGLQENIKTLANVRADVNTAGAKELRDIKCFTCDANAVMRANAINLCPVEPLPPYTEMTPKIVYELEKLRKKKASGDYHTVPYFESRKTKKSKCEEDYDPCIRWCGGSHTMTDPVQRVSRKGHFIQQWGKNGQPKGSGVGAGTDGKFYKISLDDKDIMRPKKIKSAPVSKVFPPPPKPLTIVSGCICLQQK